MTASTIRGVRSPLIFLLDFASIIAIFSGIYYLRLGLLPDYWSIDLWIIPATFILALFITGTYFREGHADLPSMPIRTFFVCLFAGGVCVIWLYLLGPKYFNQYFGRGILPVSTIACGIATTLIRFFVNRAYYRQEQLFEILYLGYSDNGRAFLKELENHSDVRSITIATTEKINPKSESVNVANSGPLELLAVKQWQSIIIDPTYIPDKQQTERLVEQRLGGTTVFSLTNFYEKYWYMVPIHGIDNEWFLRSQGFSVLDNPVARRVKRAIDVLFSLILLVASMPLICFCAVIIKLSSRGPALFKQTRVGLQGKEFTIYKLRTMRHDAESTGIQWAQINDPRITRVGGILRKTRLDELPQCWNILQGNMSFVGPRPERPEFTQDLANKIPYYDLRHLVKPGLTGWAQVIFPYGASVEDSLKKLQYELFYIKNQSLLLDLNIVLRTLITVFQRSGR